jgi:hypothetical protein
MGFSITGYVLEPPRVGQSNSPFTSTPNNFISNSGAFNAAYPSSEANPRDDYLVIVTSEGDLPNVDGLIAHAKFGWTKNEIVQRFDYESKNGRFRTLPGGQITVAGTLGPNSNSQRLTVTPPLQLLATAPYRLSIGSVGSGTTQTVALVLTDGDFGSPPAGTTELSLSTGHLNWNPADLTTYNGQTVRWQQQQYFPFSKSTGRIGTIGDQTILLNPLPATTQYPLIRIGSHRWLLTVEVPNEGSFGSPPAGTVQWARTTGKLNFSNADIIANPGLGVYFDGTLLARDLLLPRQALNTITAPGVIGSVPPAGGDLIFALPNANPYYQFPQFVYTSSFDPIGQAGTVQVNPGTGGVQFSLADKARFGAAQVQVIFGDLAIENGISMRFFRSPVNLDAQTAGVKDVTALYTVTDAVWANPIIGSPQVFLPSVPVDDNTLIVTVNQGQGTFTGTLPRLDLTSPPAGLGYTIDFDSGTFQFAQRKNNILIPLQKPAGAAQLSDPLVLAGNVQLSLETSPGTGIYSPLTIGTDCLFDPTAGIVLFTTTSGVNRAVGSTGAFSGTTFTDTGANFISDGVVAGDYLVGLAGYAKGVYTITSVAATSVDTDVPPPAGSGPLSYEILSGKEILADRFFQKVQLIDPNTSVERIVALGTGQNETSIVSSGTATYPDFVTLSDGATDFIVSGVQIGDTIRITSGPDSGSSRSVTSVAQHALTVDSGQPFVTLSSSTYRVYRRLHIPKSAIGVSRIRFGNGSGATFSSVVTTVSTDTGFTNPSILPAGHVEVSQATGNLNFNSGDLAPPRIFYWVRKLTLGTDYQVQPALGFITFAQRMLANEEILLTYVEAPPITSPPTPPAPPIVGEPGTFLVRKELTQPHPSPTSVLTFNPTGKTVASNPAPKVYRGGRPQDSSQVVVNTAASTITFLPDNQLTDALPHGAVVAPTERVLIDYFVYEANGGEKSITVLNPPMLTAQVAITQGQNSVIISGDQTSIFQPNFLLRIEQVEVYQIGSSSYDSGANQTTVTLSGTQTFQNDYINPNLYIVSGPTPTSAPAYFVQELQAFGSVARGMNAIVLQGDRTSAYSTNTIVEFTDGLVSFRDFYIVTAATFDETVNQTTLTLASNAIRQYVFGQQFLSYSIRPIFEKAPTVVHTRGVPVTTQPITVFRRIAGQVGKLLTSPTDYTIDDSGTIVYASPLLPNEEFSIFDTEHRTVSAGLNLKASYTCTIAPNQLNGLLGQVLNADYTVFSPDNFYYRVETMTNFKGEVQQTIQAAAQAGSPSSGPMTSNSSSPQLFNQGRDSVYFQEGHLANVDIIARTCLKFFNDAVNDLEDVLHAIDGRVVGDSDGRFLFDGNINNPVRTSVSQVTNQIDDLLVASPFPIPGGFVQQIYLPGPHSRFFKNRRNIFTPSPAQVGGSPHDGDIIAKFNYTSLFSLPPSIFKRWPRAQIQFDYPYGTTVFTVDNANGTSDALQRPAFITQMRVVIEDPQGRFYITDADTATVLGVTPTTITISLGAHSPTPGPDPGFVPAGSTIYVSPSDANSMLKDGNAPPPTPSSNGAYMMIYPIGKDVDANLSTGELLYITRKFPFDGIISSLPPPANIIPKSADIYPIQNGDVLQANGAGVNVNYTAPFKFSALFGGTLNDDGDQSVPIVGPTFDGELTPSGGGPLNVEAQAETPITGTLRTNTTAPFLGTGNLDVTKTIITLTAGNFPSPVPKVHDLVRILSGTNGATSWRRITAVTPNSVTVGLADAFASVDTNFQFTVAVSGTAITGTATLAGTTLTDLLANFLGNGTEVGYTVVMTGGPNIGLRRQIVAITSATTLTLDSAFPNPAGGTYRIDNPLDTYSGPIYTGVQTAVATEIATISTNPKSEQTSIFNFFTTVFTTVLSSAAGSVPSPGSSLLNDGTVNFLTSGVTTSHFVYIPTGTNAGIYGIGNVTAHQITIATTFPLAGAVTYQIVKAFGVSLATLQAIFGILGQNATFLTQTQAFQPVLNTQVPVLLSGVPDPAEFAIGLQTADLDTRSAQVQARLTYLADPGVGPRAILQSALASSERLYDKRFTWIDARINLQSGYLVLQQTAAANRVKQQQDVFNQLIKLLTVEGS